MKKQIQITMPDGSIYGVPAEIIAEDRAKYYARLDTRDCPEDFEKAKQREFEYTMSNNSEILDWMENNMDWDDVSRVAVLVKPPADLDFQEGWLNGEKRIHEYREQ